MLIRFWGVRGSISAPGASTMRYGGNTPCVEVEGKDGANLVLDAGYGVVGLGQRIMERGNVGKETIHLVLTHLHWDHIQGLPFFAPIYVPGNQLIIHSVSTRTARRAMERLFTSVYSPIKGVENLGATILYDEVGDELRRGGLSAIPIILNHGVPTLGFRIEEGGAVACHATDHEGGHPPDDARLIEAARGADLMIHDAQFTPDEYKRYTGWGHSHTGAALANALAAGVRRLVLFHYDPTHTDLDVDGQLIWARRALGDRELEVLAAAEGLELTV